ncbi:hypothetical protein SAMN05216483_6770 [Streptomyces sp. 2131.1]|uniref:hypothetical protein n=1 Tax=Streptomyces sp. 2131.1 TaxID=1855346 RepID=UPI00089CA285|nr:hypothetical protein [Streptomyces sp. 2131.1]SEE84724.1 hypothetical protein SAMN05216483_6770 [Streptomyces sp. 2131.1]
MDGHAFPHLTNETGFAATAAAAARDLGLVLEVIRPTCVHYVEQHSGGGAHVRIHYVATPDDELPAGWAWALGDVKRTLAENGIMTGECRREPGPRLGLNLTLPATSDVRRLTALIESGMTDLERAALHLTRALNEAGFKAQAAVEDEVIQPLALHADEALSLWKLLRGAPDKPAHIDISTLPGLDQLARDLMQLLDQVLDVLIEAKAGCDSCFKPDRVIFGELTADEAQALAAVVSPAFTTTRLGT